MIWKQNLNGDKIDRMTETQNFLSPGEVVDIPSVGGKGMMSPALPMASSSGGTTTSDSRGNKIGGSSTSLSTPIVVRRGFGVTTDVGARGPLPITGADAWRRTYNVLSPRSDIDRR